MCILIYMKKDRKINIYIIGIGGKGLNSIAEFCHEKGYRVSGSDQKESLEITNLKNKNISIILQQDGSGITPDIDIVVYSSIIQSSHRERIQARKLGIKEMSRAQFLRYITKNFIRISIAGSHGKSTTSAITSLILHAQTKSINAITGAYIKEFNSYQKIGDSPYCVLEACEYSKSFMYIPGDYTIVTSLEKSHMEYYKTQQNMFDAFKEFFQKHKSCSTLIINGDNTRLRILAAYHPGRLLTCGYNAANDFVIKNLNLQTHESTFDLYYKDVLIYSNIKIKIPGSYNVLNTALTLSLMYTLGYKDIKKFKNVFENFTGVSRRFELTNHPKVTIVDDFAHHPTQVLNLIRGIKQFYPGKKIVAIFEPRQAHLIKTFIKEYGGAFKDVEEVVITDVVPALGDTAEDISNITAQEVIESVQLYSKPQSVWYAQSYKQIVDTLISKDLKDSIIATIGAGSVFKVKELLLNQM
jgi:UDP-N-acetylmuramate--alanine ligase